MEEKQTRIIEIGGVKMEVDLRHAKRVEHYRIGDRIKVLKKQYESYRSYPGVIVGFDNFEKLPTIIVCYANIDYSGCKLEFVHFNAQTDDVELCGTTDDIGLDKGDVVAKLNGEIEKKQAEIHDLEQKKAYFLAKFGQYFEASNIPAGLELD